VGSDPVYIFEDQLRAADAERMGHKVEVDGGRRAAMPTEIAERLEALDRENRELRQANEILRKTSAYFAMAELDRRSKT
jgi:transposase-like protein